MYDYESVIEFLSEKASQRKLRSLMEPTGLTYPTIHALAKGKRRPQGKTLDKFYAVMSAEGFIPKRSK